MPIYRCFCQTIDGRIITGARIESADLAAVRAVAQLRWQAVPGFARVEIWRQNTCLWPPAEAVPPAEAPDPEIGPDCDVRSPACGPEAAAAAIAGAESAMLIGRETPTVDEPLLAPGGLREIVRLPPQAAAIPGISHDLTQRLTALVTYLYAARRLLDDGAAGPPTGLQTALSRATEQAVQAAGMVGRLSGIDRSPNGGA